MVEGLNNIQSSPSNDNSLKYAKDFNENTRQEKKKKEDYNKGNLGAPVRVPENINRQADDEDVKPDQEKVLEKKGLRDRALEYKKTLDQQKKAARKLQKTKNSTLKQKTVGLRVKRLQRMYRFINGTLAVTPGGIILVVFIMNAQLIFGNLIKVKWVPKLEKIDMPALILVNFIVIFTLYIFIIILYAITHPVETTFQTIWKVIKSPF